MFAGYPAVRAGLRALLIGQPGIEVVAEFGRERMEAGWPEGIDVAVIEVFAQAGEDWPEGWPGEAPFPSVAIVDSPADGVALFRLPNAPRAILLRTVDGEQLAIAVRAAASGLMTMDPAIATIAFDGAQESPVTASKTTLTPREKEVLDLMALGLPNKAIALRLGVSENTAKFHVGTILGKLNAASRTEAVMAAARRGWLPI